MDLAAQKGTSFKFPAKRHSSKPLTLETMKYQTRISNRFDCLKYDTPVHNDTLDESVRTSPLPFPQIAFGKNRPRQFTAETLHSSSNHSSESTKSEIEHKSAPESKLLNAPTSYGPNLSVISNDAVKGNTETQLPTDFTQEENNLRRKGKVKWKGLRYGYIVIEGCSRKERLAIWLHCYGRMQ